MLPSRHIENDQRPGELPITFTLKDGDLRGAKLEVGTSSYISSVCQSMIWPLSVEKVTPFRKIFFPESSYFL